MENIISSLARFTKKQVDSAKKAISKYAGQVINLVPEPIRRTVNTFTGNLITKINGIFENKKKLPPNAAEESSPQQEVVTNKTEIKSTPNETGESSTAKEVFTNKTEIKLDENGGRVKVYKTTGNLNFDLTDKIMEKITPIIETRTKVIHAFSCVIYRGQGEIIEYSKTFKAPSGTFSSLDDIKEYIRQCEQKRLDLEDAETWSKAYLPATTTYASKGVYEGRVRFTSVSTKIILSNEPLLGCGPLPKWLADKKCIYAIDKINDNLCFWRCLTIHQRIMKGKKRPEEDTNREALKLARDFYRKPNLKREDVKPTRLVDFENIAKQFKVNIRLFELAKGSKTVWKLVFGKNQFKKNLPCVDIGLFVYGDYDEDEDGEDNENPRRGHCFFIKDIELLAKLWECAGCKQRFNRHDNYNRHVTGGTCGGGKTKLICPGTKFRRIMNSSEKVFYGEKTNFSYAACQWIEKQSELIGKHIHHALCGHGGEFSVIISGKKFFVDGYEPKTRTIFQYHGCKWHGCPCQKERNSLDEERYAKTIELEKKMKEQGFKLISVWECEKPELKKMELEKEFRPYPYFIVYDFEALHKKMDEIQTEELVITSRHVPVSVAINDNLTNEPVFIVDQDPGNLINNFIGELHARQRIIAEATESLYPQPESDDDGGEEKKEDRIWRGWVNQVPVFGFNSGRYDINMIKEYFVKNLAIISDVNVAKKENSYMFLSASKFKFLDIKNYLAPGLSYDAWCRAYGCELQKLAFPYEWFDSFDQDKNKKQLGDTAKLKGNSFYGKMIENLEKHMNTKFTTNEKLIDEIFRSPFFEDLEEISNGAFEVRQRKKQVTITRPYQCGIAVYQLAKLRMLEFYYDFLDKFCDRRDFELIQMDTDSFYMALSAEDFDDIIKPEMKELYKEEKKNWLVTDEYSKRVPGLFKAEFQGKRMIALTSKCYFADNGGEAGAKLGKDEGVKKFSCKGVSRRQNKMNWERYKNALFGSLDKARNIGFRKRDNHIVTYEQSKLGLSAYYDKRIVHEDGIHTSCL